MFTKLACFATLLQLASSLLQTSADCTSGPIGTISGALATGVRFIASDGTPVNAHGGGIIKEGDTYYFHGEFVGINNTNNIFEGFSMYSSKDLANWKNEGIILPVQPSGLLGPNTYGTRPHIIKCPATGEFVLLAHYASADGQNSKQVVYATSPTVNGQYTYRGPLMSASGALAQHSDIGAFADTNQAYLVGESGNVYPLAADCHSWTKRSYFKQINGDSGGAEAPTVFKAGSTYYWIGSYKTGYRANNNFYSTAPAMLGPWTYQGFVAPVTNTSDKMSDQKTWLSQTTWVQPVAGCQGTTYVYFGDHWYGTLDPKTQGLHNYEANYVVQPLVFSGTAISMPTYHTTWQLNAGLGTWSA